MTCWRVRGEVAEVFEVLREPLALPRWWPDVYRSARETKAGDADGVGQEVLLHTRGALPYTLRWTVIAVGGAIPTRLTLNARGDLEGEGEWQLWQHGEYARLRFEWRVRARKPLLRRAWMLRPLFVWNHRWAMRRGELRLRQELRRRVQKRL